MKRTNWIDISYWHYYPDGMSGGILCGLSMPPGRKMNKSIQGRCFDFKAPSLFYVPTYFDKIRRNIICGVRENIHRKNKYIKPGIKYLSYCI